MKRRSSIFEAICTLVSVDVSVREDAVSFDTAKPVFKINVAQLVGPSVRAQYDVRPEGDRFVVNVDSDTNPAQVRVVLNWHQELLEKIPGAALPT